MTNQIWNVTITIDKVMHVLKEMGTMEPPIRNLGSQEIYHKMWLHDHSIKHSLLTVLNSLEDSDLKKQTKY